MKLRWIATFTSPVAVYLSFSFVCLNWNPLQFSDSARLLFALLMIATPFLVVTCPFWEKK